MIWQWITIAALVLAAVAYLVRTVRHTLRQPVCSSCAGCKPSRWAKVAAKLKKMPETQVSGRDL